MRSTINTSVREWTAAVLEEISSIPTYPGEVPHPHSPGMQCLPQSTQNWGWESWLGPPVRPPGGAVLVGQSSAHERGSKPPISGARIPTQRSQGTWLSTALKQRQRKEHFPTRTDRKDPLIRPGGDRERYFRADSELMGFTVTLLSEWPQLIWHLSRSGMQRKRIRGMQ